MSHFYNKFIQNLNNFNAIKYLINKILLIILIINGKQNLKFPLFLWLYENCIKIKSNISSLFLNVELFSFSILIIDYSLVIHWVYKRLLLNL
jgi:hypothetical protein